MDCESEQRSNRLLLGIGFGMLALGFLPRFLSRLTAVRPAAPKGGKPGWAVVTGASSGIGESFARHLAARGYDLVLIARREERLQRLASEMVARHGIEVQVLPTDLSQPSEVDRLVEQLGRLPNVGLLVNNAGFGSRGRFAEIAPGSQVDMAHVHNIAPMRLSRAVLPGMVAARRGGIINVASLAGYLALPGNIIYSATKSFLVLFSQGLATELHGTGVRVQALCPGLTYSKFHDELGRPMHAGIAGLLWMPAGDVVRESLEALDRGQVICVPGWVNRIFFVIERSLLTQGVIELALTSRLAARVAGSDPHARHR